jgi:Na+-transporting NADH:ubiquinone oxidoreductase subunit NqrE
MCVYSSPYYLLRYIPSCNLAISIHISPFKSGTTSMVLLLNTFRIHMDFVGCSISMNKVFNILFYARILYILLLSIVLSFSGGYSFVIPYDYPFTGERVFSVGSKRLGSFTMAYLKFLRSRMLHYYFTNTKGLTDHCGFFFL